VQGGSCAGEVFDRWLAVYSMPTLIRCTETRTAAAAEMTGDSHEVRSPVVRVSVAIPAKNPSSSSSSQPSSQRALVMPSGAQGWGCEQQNPGRDSADSGEPDGWVGVSV
jgi:hypothetical protein